MRSAPRQLHVAAAGDRQHNAVRTTSGWVLALEPGDYDLYWLPSGPRLPLCSGLHLEPGESRELQVRLPATSVCRGDIANWQQLQPRLRARMVRIGAIRANIDRADGTFELLLAEPLPATLEVELSRFTTDSFSMAARPARVLDRDDADGRLLIEDTFAELPRMRVRCESQHDGAVGIQIYRRVPAPHLYCVIAADDEVLLPEGDQELLLIAIEKVGQRSWPLTMQVVPCVAGEVVLQPGTRAVPVTGCSDGWWITTFPAAPWQTCEVGVSVLGNSTVLLPTSAAGARARRGELVREFPAPVTLIDLR
jgi:hypothetical protein